MILSFINRILNLLSADRSVERLSISKTQIMELSWLGTGQVMNLMLAFLSMKLMTSVGPAEYGKFILASSITGIFTLVYFGPLEQGYIRFYFEYAESAERRAIYLDSLKRILQGSMACIVFLSFVGMIIGKYYLDADPLFIIGASFMVGIAASSVPLQGMMNALRLRKHIAILQLIEKIVVISSLVLFFFIWRKDVSVLLFCIVLGTGLGLFLRFYVYRRQYPAPSLNSSSEQKIVNSNFLREVRSRITIYSLPFLLWGGITWLQLNGERWIINQLLDSSEVGRYGLASLLISSTAVVGATIIAQYVTPIIFQCYSSKDQIQLRRGWKIIKLQCWLTLILFSFFAVLFFFLGDSIIRIVSSDTYSIPRRILVLLSIGIGLFYISQALTNVGLALQKPRIYIIPKITAASLSIAAYYVGCHYDGISGVAAAIVFVNVVYLFLIILTNQRLISSLGKSIYAI
jgi:O-antigen/teichoic acid export membrane protein